jgi:hypothetical protein
LGSSTTGRVCDCISDRFWSGLGGSGGPLSDTIRCAAAFSTLGLILGLHDAAGQKWYGVEGGVVFS